MNLFRLRHHVVTWALLILVAAQALYVVPARQRYFSHLPSPGHAPWAVEFYVAVLPVLEALVYALLATAPWQYQDHRRLGARVSLFGAAQLLMACALLIALDRFGFRWFFGGLAAPEPIIWDVLNSAWIPALAGYFVVLIDGLSASRASHARKAVETRDALVEARGRLVVAQLDPHNIINVMANVGALIHKDPARAALMLDASGDYLRRVLDSTKAPRIALWQEREIIEDYLAVETIRMGDRLQVEWDWDDALDDLQIPPILVQPLVENAIKHGVWPCKRGGAVAISAARRGNTLSLEVRNTGEALASGARAGATGLPNLRARLAHEYGPDAGFTLATDGPFTVATITLPMEPACVS